MTREQARRVASEIHHLIAAHIQDVESPGPASEEWLNRCCDDLIVALTTPSPSPEGAEAEAVRLLREWEEWWETGKTDIPRSKTRTFLSRLDSAPKGGSSDDRR